MNWTYTQKIKLIKIKGGSLKLMEIGRAIGLEKE